MVDFAVIFPGGFGPMFSFQRSLFHCLVAFLVAAVLAGSASAADSRVLNWVQLFPATSPSAREGPMVAYDPVSRKVVLFGGFSGASYLNDTWTFDGVTWTQVTTPVAPPARVVGAMAFDAVIRKLVLFGGYNRSFLGDTWLWDGATSTWTQAFPQQSPIPATGPMAFSDPLAGHVDVYGGFDGRFYDLDTWRWTGTNWKHLNPTNIPSARSASVAALDLATKNVVLFDGLGDVNPYNTWTWDGTDWTQQSPQVQPPSRYFAGYAYEPHLRAVVVFGGGEGGVDINDTWLWTPGNQWSQATPVSSPPVREAMGMVFDRAFGHIVIFGGKSGSQHLNDTWELTVQ
jgi:hypothetical protein